MSERNRDLTVRVDLMIQYRLGVFISLKAPLISYLFVPTDTKSFFLSLTILPTDLKHVSTTRQYAQDRKDQGRVPCERFSGTRVL